MNTLKTICFLALILACFSCEKDEGGLTDYSYFNESTIFSSSTTVQFREVLLVIKPYIKSGAEKKFIVSDTILNVKVKMNNILWSNSSSLSLDTSAVSSEVNGNYLVTDMELKYGIIAGFQPVNTVLTTAGEYSDLLRNYMTIEPGVYFCRVESFEIKLKDGTHKKVVPLISEMIEITSTTRSLFLGEFEVEVK